MRALDRAARGVVRGRQQVMGLQSAVRAVETGESAGSVEAVLGRLEPLANAWKPRQEVLVAENFALSYGGTLPEVRVTVEQWGDPSLPDERTVVIMPSFSHGSHVASSLGDPSPGWWEGMMGPGKYIDTNHWRVISPSILGSPFGSTNPSSVNPTTGAPFRMSFPSFTPLDQARVHAQVLDVFGVHRPHAVIGASMGGMQALQFAAQFPERLERLVALVTTPKTTPGSVATRYIQRQAIMLDPAWRNGHYDDEAADVPVQCQSMPRGPVTGVRVARMLGMMGYRSREEFDSRFDWHVAGGPRPDDTSFEVESYLEYQGAKFANSGEFDANSYLFMSKAMDLMDLSNPHVTPGRTLADAAADITADSLFIGVHQDTLTPAQELVSLSRMMRGAGRTVETHVLESMYGHDAFLKEFDRMGPLIRTHLERGLESRLQKEKVHTTGLSSP